MDVGLFGPLQYAYSKVVDDSMCSGVTRIFKGNFLPLYVQARTAAYTSTNIASAWRATGTYPLNSRLILNTLPELARPSTSSSIQPAILFPIPSTPKDSRTMSKIIRQCKLLLNDNIESADREQTLNTLVDQLQRFKFGLA